jgi:hypothetical protein
MKKCQGWPVHLPDFSPPDVQSILLLRSKSLLHLRHDMNKGRLTFERQNALHRLQVCNSLALLFNQMTHHDRIEDSEHNDITHG